MNDNNKLALFLAALGHIAIIVLVVAIIFLKDSLDTDDNYVFEVIDTASFQEEVVIPEAATPQPAASVIISYEEFIRKEGKPKTILPRPRKPIKSPKIGVSLGNVSELASYRAKVRSLIDRYWQQPSNFDGYSKLAQINFSISSSGELLDIRLAESSGSHTFDDSILNAFQHINHFPPPPKRQSMQFSMRFTRE